MNENKNFAVRFFALVFCLMSSGALSGCRTTGADINQSVIEHSMAVERSQNAQRELIAIIDRAERRLDNIEKTAGSLSGNINRLTELFIEYDKIVRELIEGIKQVKTELGGGKKDNADTVDNTNSNISN